MTAASEEKKKHAAAEPLGRERIFLHRLEALSARTRRRALGLTAHVGMRGQHKHRHRCPSASATGKGWHREQQRLQEHGAKVPAVLQRHKDKGFLLK